jgi:hypothetical protein
MKKYVESVVSRNPLNYHVKVISEALTLIESRPNPVVMLAGHHNFRYLKSCKIRQGELNKFSPGDVRMRLNSM